MLAFAVSIPWLPNPTPSRLWIFPFADGEFPMLP